MSMRLSSTSCTKSNRRMEDVMPTLEDWNNYQEQIKRSPSEATQSHVKGVKRHITCDADGCYASVKQRPRSDYAYSKYCLKHTRHNNRHGHPTKKMPRVTPLRPRYRTHESDKARSAYLVGRSMVSRYLSSSRLGHVLKSIQNEKELLANWEPPSVYQRAADMDFPTRWKWYRHHLLVNHDMEPIDLLRHQVGLVTVLKTCPEIFASERMEQLFLSYRWLQVKQLPRHGLDYRTGKSKKHESLDTKTAKWMYRCLEGVWDAVPEEAKGELGLLINEKNEERANKVRGWTEDGRKSVGRTHKKRQNQAVSMFRCLDTGAYIGKLADGRLKVLQRGNASDEQLKRLTGR